MKLCGLHFGQLSFRNGLLNGFTFSTECSSYRVGVAKKKPRCSSKDRWQNQALPSKIRSWEPNSVGDLLLSSISRKSLTLIFHSAQTHDKSIGRSEKLILQETLSEPFQFAVYIFAHNIDQNMRSLAGNQSKSLWSVVQSSNLSGYLIS